MDKIYRDIYFKKNIIQNGTGSVDVKYTGHLYSNAERIKGFREKYDKNVDLFIPCSDCAAHKYGKFIKV